MTSFERIFLNLSTAIVGLSGLAYGVMKYLMTTDDPFAAVNHPLQPWALDLHLLGAPLLIFGIGLVIQDHILAQLRKKPNRGGRGTGLVALACLLPMASTGYLIQVFINETARAICVAVHLTTGIVYLWVYVAHLAISRRIAARRKLAAVTSSEEERYRPAAWMKRRSAPIRAGRPAQSASPASPAGILR